MRSKVIFLAVTLSLACHFAEAGDNVNIRSAPPAVGIKKEQVLTVMQNEWALLLADSHFRFLSSNDATSCVMVFWRASDGSSIAHSHFDIATDVKTSIQKIVHEFRQVSNSQISVILSGESSDAGLLSEIKNSLEFHKVKIESIAQERNLVGGFKADEIYPISIYSDSLGAVENRWQVVQQDFDQLRPRYEASMTKFGRMPNRSELQRTLRKVGH